jgi:4-hydroxy-3-methylbut-2-en-1-yl diphosphate synthase IspG/GcpE
MYVCKYNIFDSLFVTEKIQCPICERTMISVYNLLTHLKGHSEKEVHKYKRAISVTLAGVSETKISKAFINITVENWVLSGLYK